MRAKECPPNPLKKALGERFDSLPQTPSHRPKGGNCGSLPLETHPGCSPISYLPFGLTS